MIKFNEITSYSKISSIVLFLGVLPVLTFYIGTEYQKAADLSKVTTDTSTTTIVKQSAPAQTAVKRNPVASSVSDASVGIITQNDDETSTYTNNDYGFAFSFPSSWRVGDNHIDYGTFQIMNYSVEEADSNPAIFGDEMNKIEMNVFKNTASGSFDLGSNFVEVGIAGQTAYFNQLTNDSYLIELPSHPDTYLSVTIYGDSGNYSILKKVVESLTWL